MTDGSIKRHNSFGSTQPKLGVYSPPQYGGEQGGTLPKERPFQMAEGGSMSPPKLPPSMGGSTEEPAAGGKFWQFGSKFLCFNRDFEVAEKIRVLPPRVGGSTGGTFLPCWGGAGGSTPPLLRSGFVNH